MEHSNANHGKRSALIFLACLSLALPYHTLFGTETPPTETKIAEIQQIIDLTIAQDYDRAFAMCKELQQLFPAHPMGFFFEAATLQAQMLDYENYQARKRFFALTDKIRRLGKEALHNDSKNSWLYFYIGGALGYQAYFLGREHHYWQAFREGWDSIKALETAVALDSSNYDAYLGIGSYRYYRSKFSKYLSWLPFVDDEKQAGIRMIEQAIDKGKFSRAAALNSLIWIYIGEEMYAEAEKLIEQALQRYPNSRFFLWGKATAASEQKKWQQAESVYHQILQSYANEGTRSHYNELLCHARLAEIYSHLGKTELAQTHAYKALQIDVANSMRKRAKKFQKLAEDILKKLQAPAGSS